MERLNWHMVEQLCHAADVHVIAPEYSDIPSSARASLLAVKGKPLWRFLAGTLWRSLSDAFHWHPNVIIAGSGLTAPFVWLAARICGARTAVYLHGLDIGLRHALYTLAWLPFTRNMDVVIVNSTSTHLLAMSRGICEEKIRILHPGVALPERKARKDQDNYENFRAAHGLGAGPILLSVGRLTERKGLREFVRDVFPLIASQHPDIQLAVIGETANNALAARSQSVESIRAEAAQHSLADRVHFIGAITDRTELSLAYESAAVHVFPVREIMGDPEGFGMVAIEAAAHGLPTVAYATGGVVDAVSDGVSGYLIPPHDAEAFAHKVSDLLQATLPPENMLQFASKFAWPAFGAALHESLDIASSGRAQAAQRGER